jgi:hypothetical protein
MPCRRNGLTPRRWPSGEMPLDSSRRNGLHDLLARWCAGYWKGSDYRDVNDSVAEQVCAQTNGVRVSWRVTSTSPAIP